MRYNEFGVLKWTKNAFQFTAWCPALSEVFGGSFTDRNLPDAQSNLGLWGDGKGEDELSPEEIQMVSISCILFSILLYFLLYSCLLRKYRLTQIHFQLSHYAE